MVRRVNEDEYVEHHCANHTKLEVKNPLAIEKDPSSEKRKNDSYSKLQQPLTWTSKHIAPDGIFVSLRHVAEAVLDLRVLRHQHRRVRRITPQLVITNGLTHSYIDLYIYIQNAREILDVIGLSVNRVTFSPKRLSIVDS